MNNDEINAKLVALENRRTELVNSKTDLETGYSEYKNAFLSKKSIVEKELIGVQTEIAQLRRQFKIEGFKTQKIRKLTTLEKKLIIEKRGNRCERCGSTIALTVHHKIPLSHGGSDKEENLEAVCGECNKKIHRI